jgi:hypothetical protein
LPERPLLWRGEGRAGAFFGGARQKSKIFSAARGKIFFVQIQQKNREKFVKYFCFKGEFFCKNYCNFSAFIVQ